MDIKPITVCENCFTEMKAISVRATTLMKANAEYCSKCKMIWRPLIVAQDPIKHNYVRIRMKTESSILVACENSRTCTLVNCPFAHNQLELNLWKDVHYQNSWQTSNTPDSNYSIQDPTLILGSTTMLKAYNTSPNSSKKIFIPNPLQYDIGMPHNNLHSSVKGRGLMKVDDHAPSIAVVDDIEQYFEKVLISMNTNDTPPNNIKIISTTQPLTIKIALNKSPEIISWNFLITNSKNIEVLHAVILETNFEKHFRIGQANYLDKQTKAYRIVNPSPETERRGIVLTLRKAVNEHCSVDIPVEFKVELGEFKARLIFDFSRLQIVRRLNIHVHRECHNIQALQNVQDRFNYLTNRQRTSLLWDKDYEVIYVESPYLDKDFDDQVYTSKIPVNLDEIIKNEKHVGVLSEELTYKNYKRIFEMLLYLEEFECRKMFLKYDLKDQTINTSIVCNHFEKYDKGRGGTEFAGRGLSFLKLEMCASLFEGFHFLRPPNIALIKPRAPQNLVYYCPSVELGHDYIWVVVSDKMITVCEQYGGVADIRFKDSSIDLHFSSMHQALQLIDSRTLFPSIRVKTETLQTQTDCSLFWDRTNLSSLQRKAIECSIDCSFQNVPTIISGPFGCGKSWTLANLAYMLGIQQNSKRVLICCKNNFPANKYIDDIHGLSLLYGTKLDLAAPSGLKRLFRFFTPIRRVTYNINDITKQYSILNNEYGRVPQKQDLYFCRIIVTTVFTCEFLIRMGLPRDFFTHIIIDEAALVSEPELNIPISLAGHFTKIILAGDEYQVTPKLSSPISRKFGLELSLLERLSKYPVYKDHSLILLRENYRSDPAIVNILSRLYYDQTLRPMRDKPSVPHDGLKPLEFRGVISNESKITNFPSYMNASEAEEIVHIVRKLNDRFHMREIGILSVYIGQVWLIRDYLRKERLFGADVLTFEAIQGKEYRVLIIDTVRTLSKSEYTTVDPHTISLLEEPKLLNTILGRAKDHIIVVGNPYTLCQVGRNKAAWRCYLSECINLGSFYIGNNQTFQFPFLSDDIFPNVPIHAHPKCESNVNRKRRPNCIHSKVFMLIEQRAQSLKEAQDLWEEAVLTHPHLQEHYEKVNDLIATQTLLIQSEKTLAEQLKYLDDTRPSLFNPENSNW